MGIPVFRLFICFFLFISIIIAQPSIDLVRPPMPDTLFLRVQRPDKDTVRTFALNLRIAACTRPEAKAFINSKQTKVYPSGAFVGLASINVGVNILRFTVKLVAGDSVWKEFIVIRPEPMKNSPRDDGTIARHVVNHG
jgi:hypothetical protein